MPNKGRWTLVLSLIAAPLGAAPVLVIADAAEESLSESVKGFIAQGGIFPLLTVWCTPIVLAAWRIGRVIDQKLDSDEEQE